MKWEGDEGVAGEEAEIRLGRYYNIFKLESRFRGERSTTSHMQMIAL